jgi:hydroxylaminobenzene mutase
MTTNIDDLKANLRRWTLILGVLQITVGCVVGFIPPSAVQWFRGIVMAHIEFTANGVLLVAFGFLVRELRLNPTALKVWFATLQIGTWTNGLAGVAAAFIGASSKLMPTLNEKFPPPHGTDNPIVTGSLMLCGVTIMVALLLTFYGLLRSKTSSNVANA